MLEAYLYKLLVNTEITREITIKYTTHAQRLREIKHVVGVENKQLCFFPN